MAGWRRWLTSAGELVLLLAPVAGYKEAQTSLIGRRAERQRAREMAAADRVRGPRLAGRVAGRRAAGSARRRRRPRPLARRARLANEIAPNALLGSPTDPRARAQWSPANELSSCEPIR